MKPAQNPNKRTNRNSRTARQSAATTAAGGSPSAPATIPAPIATLRDAYLTEPLKRTSDAAPQLATALTDFFAALLPDTSREALFTVTKFCLMELALIKLTRLAGDTKQE